MRPCFIPVVVVLILIAPDRSEQRISFNTYVQYAASFRWSPMTRLFRSTASETPPKFHENTLLKILADRVKTWAHKLGFELSQLGKYVTNVEKFHESYKQEDVTARDGKSLVHEIAKDIKTMMESKISAIKVRAVDRNYVELV